MNEDLTLRRNMDKRTVDHDELRERITGWVRGLGYRPRRSLLLPPDFTRSHSWAGEITALLYEELSPFGRVDVMPALGTHRPMTEGEKRRMFGTAVPPESFVTHHWRRELRQIGELPGDFISRLSEGKMDCSVRIEVNRRLLETGYDLVVSIGQVVPHEVAGMANYNKNIFVGCGGKDMIDKSHFLGAVCGLERIMGRTDTPVRRLFDEAERSLPPELPLHYILTVTSVQNGVNALNGVFIGQGRDVFEDAARLSRSLNLNLLEKPLRKVVAYLPPGHFRSTWLGNKAIYRTRMAIAAGGELIIVAPGVGRFGEDAEIDRLIRRTGYCGAARILEQTREDSALRANLSAAAHLIHGSTEGRFDVVYAAGKLSREEVEGVGFRYLPLDQALKLYHPARLADGFNTLSGGEEIFFVGNPALGLWALREQFVPADGG